MAHSSLLESVEESARERERELKEHAERTIRDIRKDSEEQAGRIIGRHRENAERDASAERNRALFLTNARNREDAIRAWERLYDRSFSVAGHELAGVRSGPGYPAIFSALLREAIGSLKGTDVRVRIDPADAALCEKTLAGLGTTAEIVFDISTAGGVIVTNKDGTVVIANTVESRLERAKELLRLELFRILDGG